MKPAAVAQFGLSALGTHAVIELSEGSDLRHPLAAAAFLLEDRDDEAVLVYETDDGHVVQGIDYAVHIAESGAVAVEDLAEGDNLSIDEAAKRSTFGEIEVGQRFAKPGRDAVYEKTSKNAAKLIKATTRQPGGSPSRMRPDEAVILMGPKAHYYGGPNAPHQKPENIPVQEGFGSPRKVFRGWVVTDSNRGAFVDDEVNKTRYFASIKHGEIRLHKEGDSPSKPGKPLSMLPKPVQAHLRSIMSESTDPEDTMTLSDAPVLHVTDDAVVLSLGEGDDATEVCSFECDTDDEREVRAGLVRAMGEAEDAGFDLDVEAIEEGDEEALDALADHETDVLDLVRAYLADHLLTAESVDEADMARFERAIEEGNYEQAFALADLLAASIGDDVLEAVKRMSLSAIRKRARNAKIQTPEERKKNRMNKLKRRRGSAKAKARRYRLRYRARPGSKRESVEEAGSASAAAHAAMKGKGATDDALRDAMTSFFAGTMGKSTALKELKPKMLGAGYTGVKGASDSQFMRVLASMTKRGTVKYAKGKGYSANESAEEFADEDAA